MYYLCCPNTGLLLSGNFSMIKGSSIEYQNIKWEYPDWFLSCKGSCFLKGVKEICLIHFIHSPVSGCKCWAKLCLFQAEAYYSQRAWPKNSTQSTKDKVCGFGWVAFHEILMINFPLEIIEIRQWEIFVLNRPKIVGEAEHMTVAAPRFKARPLNRRVSTCCRYNCYNLVNFDA